MLSLELGPEVANLICDCCGKPFQSVNGYITKDDWAYSIYFASLQTGHAEIEVGLTISIGKWWEEDDEAIAQRQWMYMRSWPSESGRGVEIRVEEPDGSRHVDSRTLGKKIICHDARAMAALEAFFDVARFIIDNDPAVLSYLNGQAVNIEGRVCRHA